MFAQDLGTSGDYIPPYSLGERQATLYQQDGTRTSSSPSQKTEYPSANSEIADDFIVPAGQRWEIEKVFTLAFYADSGNSFDPVTDGLTQPKSMIINVYSNFYDTGTSTWMPGTLLASRQYACIVDDQDGTITASLIQARDVSDTSFPYTCLQTESTIDLGEGHYWIGVIMDMDYVGSHPGPPNIDFIQWFWTRCNEVTPGEYFYPAVFRNPGGGLSSCATWAPITGCVSGTGNHSVFSLLGNFHSVTPANTGPYCEGATIELTANYLFDTASGQTITYSWTGPNGYTSTQTNPQILSSTTSHSGTYSVTVTNDAGGPDQWQITNSTAVIVYPFPAQPTPGSNSTEGSYNYVCESGNIELYGLPVISGATYSWTGPGSFVSSQQNPVINNASNSLEGNYSLTITQNGCSSGPVPVQVTVGIVAGDDSVSASSNSPVCVDGTLQLSVTEINGASYSWQGPNAQTSSEREPSFTNAGFNEEGTWTVTVTVGSCSSQAQTVVDIAPETPVATNDGPACEGADITLSATGPAGSVFHWTGPDSFTDTGASVVLTAVTDTQAGTYSVTAEVDGCTSLPDSTTVTVKTKPETPVISSNQPVCVGDTLELYGPEVTGATYGWTGPGGWTSTLRNPTRDNVQDNSSYEGAYLLTITVDGCDSDAGSENVTVGSSSGPPVAPDASSNSPVCLEGTLNLDSTESAEGYRWIGPNGQSYSEDWGVTTALPTVSVSPVSRQDHGTWKLYIFNNGCSSPAAEITVEVNPQAPAITGPSESCEGESLVLTATVVTGAVYEWKHPSGTVLGEMGHILTVDPVQMSDDGAFSVSLTTPDTCSSEVITHDVTVKQKPDTSAVTSNSPVCHGATLQFSAPILSGATYSWTGPQSFTSNLRNPSIPVASNDHEGTYSCEITANGCTNTGQVHVIVGIQAGSDDVTAGVNSPVCYAGALNLSATTVSGAAYSWSGPAGQSFNVQNPVINHASRDDQGIWSLLVSNNGCTSNDQVSVVVSPESPLASNNGPKCPGETVQLAATGEAGSTYHWQGPNGYTATGDTVNLTAITENQEGTYSVRAEKTGCFSEWIDTDVIVHDPDPSGTPVQDMPCMGGDLHLSVDGPLDGNYDWTGPGSWSSSGREVVRTNITLDEHGSYSLDYTSADGCTVQHKTLHVQFRVVHSPSTAVGLVNLSLEAGISDLTCSSSPLTVNWFLGSGSTSIFTGKTLVVDVTTIHATEVYRFEINDGTLAEPLSGMITLLYHSDAVDFDGDGNNDAADLHLALDQWRQLHGPGAGLPDAGTFDGNPGVDVRDYLFINHGSAKNQ
jgi:hypothetical protein